MTNKSRKLTSIIILMLVLCAIFPQKEIFASEQVNSAVLDARNGVVKVTFYLTDAAYYAAVGTKLYELEDIGDMHYSSGTGFFIGTTGENPEFLVTNEHVVDEYVNDANYGGTYVFDTGDTYEEDGKEYPVVVGAPSCELRIYYDDSNYDVAVVDTPGDVEREDLALLRLKDGATDKRVPMKLKLLSGEVTTTPVYALGFPGLLENSFTNSSKYDIGDITVEPGQITHEPKTDENGIERFPVSAIIRHGNSGGPLVTEDGYVVGVNTNGMSWDDNSEQSYYSISSKTLSRFLERANAKFELADSTGENDTENTDKAEDSGEGTDSESASADGRDGAESSTEEVNNNKIVVYGGIALAAVIIIVAVVAISRKKKTPDKQVQQTVAISQPAAQTPQKRAMLRSLSTQHNGMTVAVHSNSHIMIGRDPANCKVVFREGTEGVSGRHCSVTYEESSGDFILTDLRSTCGTFLMNGQKLTPNVPYHLKSGDGFYVGDQANSFRVELG